MTNNIATQTRKMFTNQKSFIEHYNKFKLGELSENHYPRMTKFFTENQKEVEELWVNVIDNNLENFGLALEDAMNNPDNLTREELDQAAIRTFSKFPESYSRTRKLFSIGNPFKDSSILVAQLPFYLEKYMMQENERLISSEVLFYGEGPVSRGRETNLHIKVGIGKDINSFDHVIISEAKLPIKATIKGLSMFELDECDCIIFKIDCPELTKAHEKLVKLGKIDDSHEYSAHVTLAYVNKNSFPVDGLISRLEGREFFIDNFLIKTTKSYSNEEPETNK